MRAYLNAVPLNRAARRQLRKLLGREMDAEWRSLGNIRGGISMDNHTRWVLEQAKQKGHIAKTSCHPGVDR